MGSVLVIVIIIAVVIFQSWRKVRQGARTKGTEMPRRPGSKTAEYGAGVPGGKTAKGSIRREKQHYSPRESSEKSGAASYVKLDQKGNILNAARENTVETARGNELDTLASEKLMTDVYDLMIKGPQDSLAFSRDFVSEGTDMLNRYTTLPDPDLLQEI